MGKNGVCVKKEKYISSSSESEETINDIDNILSYEEEEFIVEFLKNYYNILEELDLQFIIDREPMEDLVISIIDYEWEYNFCLEEKHFKLLGEHFNVDYRILISRYLKIKNQ